MENREKRILWLINHTTLRNSELPLLKKMGYEIFTPKRFPDDDANKSASIDYTYDEYLTIPPNLLKQLNEHDFYTDDWSINLNSEINKYFGTVVCAFFPAMVRHVVNDFSGRILFRVFGLADKMNYATLLENFCGEELTAKIKRNKSRIWLAQSYPNISKNEPEWLREMAVTLPLGIPEKNWKNKRTWTGIEKKILFVCPRIKSSSYYENIYNEFKRTFGKLPHAIAGAQTVVVDNDEAVLGFTPTEKYEQMMKEYRVMFYHSREERHLHYHPLEAIIYGMPLIYLKGGMVDSLAGKTLPGCCENYNEALHKVERILNDDQELIQSIKLSQECILDTFYDDYIYEQWQELFENKVMKREIYKQLTIGIWLQWNWSEALKGEGIARLLAFLLNGNEHTNSVKWVIACPVWSVEDVKKHLHELNIHMGKNIEIISSDVKEPYLVSLFKKKEKIKVGLLDHIKNKIKQLAKPGIKYLLKIVKSLIGRSVSIRSWYEFIPYLLISIAFLPFIVVTCVVYGGIKLVGEIKKKARNNAELLNSKEQKDKIKRTLKNSLLSQIVFFCYDKLLTNEFLKLGEKANQRSDINCWYVPFPAWEHAGKLKKPLVVAFPDAVYLDFPVQYASAYFVKIHSKINNLLNQADGIITYSNYVRDFQLFKGFPNAGKNVHVIPHASIDSKQYLYSEENDHDNVELKRKCTQLINDYLMNTTDTAMYWGYEYLKKFPIGDVQYLFVSSQNRYHKNYLTLFKAYEKILREKYLPLKLIITGQLDEELREFIGQRKLNYDILSISQLPPDVHAAFYNNATLAVVPTLFEGGFPFCFSESLSVGTPIVMSNIPVTDECIPLSLKKRMLFDPYNIDSICETICEALENRKELYQDQKVMMEKMLNERTWEDVREDYISVFRRVSN